MLGADVAEAVEDRVTILDRGWWDYDGSGRLMFKSSRGAAAATQRARHDILQAVRTGESDAHGTLLGMLLWGTELTRPVLGWSAMPQRFWLGRQAARDPLMVAIRTVIGLFMPLPDRPSVQG
jgi:hypothetical protein